MSDLTTKASIDRAQLVALLKCYWRVWTPAPAAPARCPGDGPWRQVQRPDFRHRNVPVGRSDERLAGVVDQTGFVYLHSSSALDDFLRRRYGCDLRIRRHPLQ